MAAGGRRAPSPLNAALFLTRDISRGESTAAFAGDGGVTLGSSRACTKLPFEKCQGLNMTPPKSHSQSLFPHEPWVCGGSQRDRGTHQSQQWPGLGPGELRRQECRVCWWRVARFWHRSAKPKGSGRHFAFLSGISFSAEGWFGASKTSSELRAVQKTPRVCSISLKHSSAGARNFPRLCIISSSSAHEEWPRGNVTFLEMLACLEQALVATWSMDAHICSAGGVW